MVITFKKVKHDVLAGGDDHLKEVQMISLTEFVFFGDSPIDVSEHEMVLLTTCRS